MFQDLCCRWGTLDLGLLGLKKHAGQICLQVQGSSSESNGYSGISIGSVHPDLCDFPPLKFLPSMWIECNLVILIAPCWPKQIWYWPGTASDRCSAGSSVPRPNLQSCFIVAGFNGMVLEAWGISKSVISKVLKAWMSTSSKVYHQIWKAYFTLCYSRVSILGVIEKKFFFSLQVVLH